MNCMYSDRSTCKLNRALASFSGAIASMLFIWVGFGYFLATVSCAMIQPDNVKECFLPPSKMRDTSFAGLD
jgi:hypothetical protein